jgi:hypothetical protein
MHINLVPYHLLILRMSDAALHLWGVRSLTTFSYHVLTNFTGILESIKPSAHFVVTICDY